MKKRILIVNRGEIAIRVAKAIRELGHIAVGVWTDNEPEASHLAFCHEWVHLSGKTNTETYLNIPKIIETIKENKIDAVHPGYGFLSENAGFVRELKKINCLFIGPHAEAIHSMGDKAESKKIAKDAGVPIVPGSVGEIPRVAEAKKVAAEIGFPVLLKAVAGGGGKGMRVCNSEQELETNFETVKREALSSFGNDGLLVEKYITDPHHIEVQILADKKGNVFHFFERECSVQRRHQKVVEEAPSPFIGDDHEVREKICSTAVALAKAVKYDSAGTVEFIMDSDKSFYFLEMNTRIQVEHPITEEVTGTDLLSNMIKVALEEDLDFKNQEEITLRGHSIECRICAEDPVTMLPAPGKVTNFHWDAFPNIRLDHCLYPGIEITPDFDPMVGKLVATGRNRDVAMRKMRTALENVHIYGLKTNIPLHKEIFRDEVFQKGIYSTKYLEEVRPQDRVQTELTGLDLQVSILSVGFEGDLQ